MSGADLHQYGHDAFSANPGFSEALFSEHEQKALQSFLDGLEHEDGFTTGSDTQMANYQAINIPRTHLSQNPNPIMLSSPQSLNTSFPLPPHFVSPIPNPSDTIKSNGSPSPTDKRRRTDTITDVIGQGSSNPAKTKRKTSNSSGGSPKSETPQIPPRRPGRRKGTTNTPSTSSPKNPLSPPQTDTPLSDSPEPSKSSARGKKPPHELLTEEEKKANHIASEQKRRANIRIGFDQLVELVPTLSACHRSEALILQKSVEYIELLISTKNDLKDRVRELTGVLGENSPMGDDSSEGELNLP